MTRKKADPSPVPEIVSKLLEDARRSRGDGPSSSLHGARAQLSATLNQAGTVLAQIDNALPARKPSLLNTVLGLAAAPQRRKSWFFGRAEDGPALSARQIEKLLDSAARDGVRLSLSDAVTRAVDGDVSVECVLPEGASDPVCTPRR